MKPVLVTLREDMDPRTSRVSETTGAVLALKEPVRTPLMSPSSSTAASTPLAPDVLSALAVAKRQQLLLAAGRQPDRKRPWEATHY